MTMVSRDPFARTELHRETIPDTREAQCDWCGQSRLRGNLFEYRTESDGGRVFHHKGKFCSASCFRSYHS